MFGGKGGVFFVEFVFLVDGFVELLFGGVEADAEFIDLSSEFFNEGLFFGGFGVLGVLVGAVGVVLEFGLGYKKCTRWAFCISLSYFSRA